VGALAWARAEHRQSLAIGRQVQPPDLRLANVAFREADAVAPRDGAGLHPLCALYCREAVLPVARERLARGELALRGLLDALDCAVLEGADLRAVDPRGCALENANTERDLARAETLWREAGGS